MEKIDLENKNLFAEIYYSNVIRKLTPKYLGKTHKIGEHSFKIERLMDGGWDLNTMWIHVHLDPDRDCTRYYMIHDACGFIPTRCLSCWKVVVKVRTVYELFQLYNLQCGMPDNVYCKCGVDIERKYVENPYNGYFYINSKEEGFERLNQVRKLVDEQISPDVPVILKQYCTEFELMHGGSKKYKQPENAEILEKIIDDLIMKYPKPDKMPLIIVKNVMENWIRTAGEILNDQSYKQFTNGESLYSQPNTYHQKIKEGGK